MKGGLVSCRAALLALLAVLVHAIGEPEENKFAFLPGVANLLHLTSFLF